MEYKDQGRQSKNPGSFYTAIIFFRYDKYLNKKRGRLKTMSRPLFIFLGWRISFFNYPSRISMK
ncbi:hypothetical protein, partial [Pollutibacter soli]|uniref:hypothetical protein n=1 Tax=Pollutibacter soli TaxID=3034157 RepID=UPI003013B1B2